MPAPATKFGEQLRREHVKSPSSVPPPSPPPPPSSPPPPPFLPPIPKQLPDRDAEAAQLAPHCDLARRALLSNQRVAVVTLLAVGAASTHSGNTGLEESELLAATSLSGRRHRRRRLGVFQDNAVDQILTNKCIHERYLKDAVPFLVLTHGLSAASQRNSQFSLRRWIHKWTCGPSTGPIRQRIWPG